MSRKREAKEGTQPQGTNESVGYTVNTTPWGGTPTNPNVAAEVEATGVDATTLLFGGSPSITINGDILELPDCANVVAGTVYRVTVTFTTGGQTLSMWFRVSGEQ